MKLIKASLTATTLRGSSASLADGVKLEVTHWWTPGREAEAVGALAEAFGNKPDYERVDGANAGGGSTARLQSFRSQTAAPICGWISTPTRLLTQFDATL